MATGLDVDLTKAISERLGWGWALHRDDGDDFDGIFAGLDAHMWDVVASGATVTEHRNGSRQVLHAVSAVGPEPGRARCPS